MNKIIAAVSSLGMALSMSVAIPAPAMAAGQNGLANFCQEYGDDFGFDSVGHCVSAIGRGQNDSSATCKYIKTNAPGLFDLLWRNHGACVVYFNDN